MDTQPSEKQGSKDRFLFENPPPSHGMPWQLSPARKAAVPEQHLLNLVVGFGKLSCPFELTKNRPKGRRWTSEEGIGEVLGLRGVAVVGGMVLGAGRR